MKRISQAVSSGDFRRIMLDGIRYPSFSEGLPTLLTCFCPDRNSQVTDNGIDLEGIRRSIRLLLNDLRNQTDVNQLVEEFLENANLLDLWKLRGLIITNVVRNLPQVTQKASPKSHLGAFSSRRRSQLSWGKTTKFSVNTRSHFLYGIHDQWERCLLGS